MNKNLLIAGLLAALFCGASRAAQKPNVIYILTDQWRADAFGFAGNPVVQTPELDRFAGEGIRFDNVVSVLPVCTPHRASLLTGRYPTTTGMFLNDIYLPSEELCMAEIFKQAGYSTAYLGKWHLDGHGRLNNVEPERRQGFDYWKALECSHEYNKMPYYENDDPEMKMWPGYSPFALSKDAQQYVTDHVDDDQPFLLFVSIGTPHFPHQSAPKEYKALYPDNKLEFSPNVKISEKNRNKLFRELRGYYAHCTATDKAIGELLAKLKEVGIYDNSIIVFTSDHGEMMGSHGQRAMSKQASFKEAALVPFIIRHPEGPKGAVAEAAFTTPDILPTLLALCGISIPETIEGYDLSAIMKDPSLRTGRAALYMNPCPFAKEAALKEYRAVRTAAYTYVEALEESPVLFDNKTDPYQLNNLVGTLPEVESDMKKKLDAELARIGDAGFKPRKHYLEKFGFPESKDYAMPYDNKAVDEKKAVFSPAVR